MEAQVTAATTILTLNLAAQDEAYFESLRQQHYPPALNRVPAHLTLFHTLPPLAEISGPLAAASDREAFAMRVTGLRSLGRGVAFVVESSELQALHRDFAAAMKEHLTAQDRQPFKPHIVIQNKARPEDARQLKVELEAAFHAFEVRGVGLTVWNYLGGPWQQATRLAFREQG